MVILAIGCLGDPPTGSPLLIGPPDIEKSPRPDADAELAALMLSGALAAPDTLYERIREDLELIREKLADSIPDVNIGFGTPWAPGSLIARFEPTFLNDTSSERYHQFDSLNMLLRLDTTRNLFLGYHTMQFTGRLHPVRLIELYQQVPGIVFLETNGIVGDGPDFYIIPDGDTFRYFFREAWGDCPSGCIYSKVYYVTVNGDDVNYIGSYLWDWQTPADPPDWIDSARTAHRQKYEQAQMIWYADHVDTLSAYFPNAVGNEWVYRVYDSLTQSHDTLTVTIVGKTAFRDVEDASIWVYDYTVSEFVDTLYIMVRDSQVLVYRKRAFDMGPFEPNLDYVIPLHVGQRWQGDELTTYKVEGVDDLFFRFDRFQTTYRIRRDIDRWGEDHLWFYPHIGLIKERDFELEGRVFKNRVLELISYRLLPDPYDP